MFWIGSSVSPQLLADLFGIDDIANLNAHLVSCFIFLPVVIIGTNKNSNVDQFARATDTVFYASTEHLGTSP